MDVPHIAKAIVSSGIEAGLDGVIVCGVCGPEVIKGCVECAGGKMVYVFTEFTHESGWITENQADDAARRASDLGAYGIQAPGTKPERIQKLRKIAGDDLVVIACGIGSQGPKPGSAIRAGADYEIIGRLIYENENPRKAARHIRSEMEPLLLS